MDTATLQFYRENAEQLSAVYNAAGEGTCSYFSQAFLAGQSVLDIGCGSGRDLKKLLDCGVTGFGLDTCAEMIDQAKKHFPELNGRVAVDSLPGLESVSKKSYDGVLCSAVLMHLPEELLFDSAYSIRRVLKSGGRLLISVPVDDVIANNRDGKGRLFNGVTPENFQLIFERIGFRLISRWDNGDSLGRVERSWTTMLFTLEASDGSRSLDKIEGILNNDKKDATYKLALFRALADIAMTNYNSALWLPNGRVALPLSSISEKWLEYYWPIIESDEFIAQKRGEKLGCQKPIAFRKQLDAVVDLYRGNGGLSAFSVDYRNKSLTKPVKSAVSKLLSKLNTTIKSGPVYYAGGGGSGTFEYCTVTKTVIMAADIWRELSIMGSWITDATILRWAELTSEISGGEVRPSQIIDCLLVTPIPEREVSVARGLYSKMLDLVCVWSDKEIGSKFDVDHAIPFALWKNNDLWNLLPADPKVNNEKRAKLPTHDLLVNRKDCIVDYWGKLHDSFTNRFEFEIAKFAGKQAVQSDNWENKLFIFSEAKDTTKYLFLKLKKSGFSKVMAVSAEKRKQLMPVISENFDANIPKLDQRYDFDIITTEVLAEGVNLHRSNTIVNYDTPWNSTRLMRRIGRVNRIGSTASSTQVYNFFPTAKVESDLDLQKRAIMKLQAFQTALGEDSQVYSITEEVDNFRLFDQNFEEDKDEKLVFLMELRKLKEENPAFYMRLKDKSLRSRVGRKKITQDETTVSFIRNKVRDVLYWVDSAHNLQEITFLQAATELHAIPPEKPVPLHDKHHEQVTSAIEGFRHQLKQELVAKHTVKKKMSTAESQSVHYLNAIAKSDLLSKEDKQMCKRAVESIKTGQFQNLPKKVKKLRDGANKKKEKLPSQIDTLLVILKEYNLSKEQANSKDEKNSSHHLNPEIIISEFFLAKGRIL